MYLCVLRDVLRGIYPMFRWLSNTCIAEMYSVVFDTYRKRILEYHGIRLNTEAQRGAYSGLSEYVKIRLYCENTSEYVRIFGMGSATTRTCLPINGLAPRGQRNVIGTVGDFT